MDNILSVMAFADANAIAAAVSSIALLLLLWLAPRIGLVDRPGGRKRHQGTVPLVGGLSILCGLGVSSMWMDGLNTFDAALIVSAAAITLVGAVDDRYGLGVRIRVLVQSVIIVMMMFVGRVHIDQLGSLWGFDVYMGWLGIPFTLIALIGLLNAFNLMDGIDGLANLLAVVAIGGILFATGGVKHHDTNMILGLLMSAMLPQLLCNLGLLGKHAKCFLGDAGSTLLGYMIGWALVQRSQVTGSPLSPVATLWCVAIPVFDTLAVMIRRVRMHTSPFKPDRRHIHYLLREAGFSPRATLAIITATAMAIWGFGGTIHTLHLGSGSNLVAFCVALVAYVYATAKLESRVQAHAQTRRTQEVSSPLAKRSAEVEQSS